MQRHFAQTKTEELASVLILGAGPITNRLLDSFLAMGFEACTQSTMGPSATPSGRQQSADDLRRLISEFKKRYSAPYFVHPGVGHWADRAEVSLIGQELGVEVLAPPARTLGLFANRLNLLSEAERVGIPNLVINSEPIHTVREIEEFMFQQPTPFVLKSVHAGGGGIGNRVVFRPEELEREIPLWLTQLRKNFGEVILFIEKYLEGARHLVVPFVRFGNGDFRTFPMTDASLQFNTRKIVTFCPSFGLDRKIEKQLETWTRKFSEEVGYVGVGALEFLVDGTRGFLIDGVARLNTEFHLWEKVSGTSAIEWQLAALRDDLAVPFPVEVKDPRWKHALSVRIYSEDSVLQLPQPGKIYEVPDHRRVETEEGEIELDFSYSEGQEVKRDSDGLIASVWAGHKNAAALTQFVSEFLSDLWVSGSLQTNLRFLIELLEHTWVRERIFHAGFVNEEFVPTIRPPVGLVEIFAAVCSSIPSLHEPKDRWVVGDQWAKPVQLEWKKGPQLFEEEDGRGIKGELSDGRRVCAFPVSEDRWQVRVDQWCLLVRKVPSKGSVKGARHLLSLVTGRVHSILFREGALAPAHEPLVMIESLQVLVPHSLPLDVRVVDWKVKPEQEIKIGQELAEFKKNSVD